MAFSLRILRWGSRRGIRNERSAARRLWRHAALVGATLPRHAARIFSACQHHRHGRLLARRDLDFRRYPLLFALAAAHPAGRVPGQSHQSSPAWRCFSKIYLSQPGRNRRALVCAGDHWKALTAPVSRSRLDPQLLHFLVVILSVKNVPLLRTFEDRPLLALDLLPGRNIDPLFVIEKFFENLAGFLPDGVGVFDEIHFIHRLERVGNRTCQHIHFIAAQSHSTALYLRTSSLFTLRNISW